MNRLEEMYNLLFKNLSNYMDYHAKYAEALMQWLADLQDFHAQQTGKKIDDLKSSISKASNKLLIQSLNSCKREVAETENNHSKDHIKGHRNHVLISVSSEIENDKKEKKKDS
jgi:hypothetical protein